MLQIKVLFFLQLQMIGCFCRTCEAAAHVTDWQMWGLCPAGLQRGSEGLHRHPGANAAHGRGLLGHGVAGEEQHHRHGYQTEGEQRGEEHSTFPLTLKYKNHQFNLKIHLKVLINDTDLVSEMWVVLASAEGQNQAGEGGRRGQGGWRWGDESIRPIPAESQRQSEERRIHHHWPGDPGGSTSYRISGGSRSTRGQIQV